MSNQYDLEEEEAWGSLRPDDGSREEVYEEPLTEEFEGSATQIHGYFPIEVTVGLEEVLMKEYEDIEVWVNPENPDPEAAAVSYLTDEGEEYLAHATLVLDDKITLNVNYEGTGHPCMLEINAATEGDESELHRLAGLLDLEGGVHEDPVDFEKDASYLDQSWEDIGGLMEQKREFRESIVGPIRNPEFFEEQGLDIPRGILLYGPPGTGKTLMAKALVSELDEVLEGGASYYNAKASDLTSHWYGQSMDLVRGIFEQAREEERYAVIVLDEIEAILPDRSAPGGNEETKKMVSEFNNLMDGMEALEGVTVIGITNQLENLDSAVKRPGRFDKRIEVPPPEDLSSRREILEIHLEEDMIGVDVSYDDLARRTNGYTGADLEQLVKDAHQLSIRRHLDGTPLWEDLSDYVGEEIRIGMQDVEEALKESHEDEGQMHYQ